MWALIKLLTSLSQSFPMLKDILQDIASALTSWKINQRRIAKDEAVDRAIADAQRKLRDKDL